MTDDLRPIDFSALTPEAIAAACEGAMQASDDAIAGVIAIPAGERTFANTMAALDEAMDALGQVSGAYAFMSYVSSDDALRGAAREWEAKLDKYMVGLGFREDLYAAIQEYAALPEVTTLSGEEARLLEFWQRDYRRNGFELPADEREEVRKLFDRLVDLGNNFRNAIDDWDDGIEVSRRDLAGLPESYIDGLKTLERDGETFYRVSLEYPDLHPFMANAESSTLRKELFFKDQRKGGPENVQRLEEAIAVRSEIAGRLGYPSWAAYVVETKMSKEPGAVRGFLAELREKVEPKAAIDREELARASEAHRRTDVVEIWDWRFYNNRLLKTEYAVDDFEVAKYFPLDACLEGLFAVTQRLLGVRFEKVSAPVWHPDVEAFDVYERDGDEPIARFYMDLFPRPNTYGHAAAFTIRSGRQRPDRTYQRPVSAIVANFTRPGAQTPSLLRHSEVETLFHEFGHILHQVLTRAKYARFSGTATERDFVEAPSQMLEHWCWDRDVLRSFSRHYETGEPLPDSMLDAMVAAKNLSSGVATLRQLFFATLDFTLHSEGFQGDSTATVKELHPITGWPFPEGTHFQSGFGHLFGYDAGYYGYLWSHVFGDDMFTRFEASDPLDEETGQEYRATVLSRGGSVDGDVMVREFLGREPNQTAFLRGLGLEVPAG
ncbi:MAG: Zn-dependent oligopeptidase [Dehalococcoidia bacterium]|nr:Zn-dependent oligopeptidase [Dehalococcoidia bacterium]